MAGLLSQASQQRRKVSGVFDQLAAMEARRNRTNEAIENQQDQQQISSIATGAGIGFQVGGPVGAGVGAAVGFLANELF